MKHVFLILPSRRLVIESFADKVGLEDYIAFKNEQLAHPDFNPEFDVLSDLRWTEFVFPPEDLNKLADYFKENVKVDIDRKGCLLTFQPMQTAYSMLFERHMTGSVVTWQVCTTEVEALSWLHYPLNLTELKRTLEELKNESLM
ncbi:hypothetical protein [Owenweeksia hongkongensis]|uniref:hypothetical protein n=1 Tax=Owenweeksia hongkongensis TaxID=253245 RepID=UPI003A8D600E